MLWLATSPEGETKHDDAEIVSHHNQRDDLKLILMVTVVDAYSGGEPMPISLDGNKFRFQFKLLDKLGPLIGWANSCGSPLIITLMDINHSFYLGAIRQ